MSRFVLAAACVVVIGGIAGASSPDPKSLAVAPEDLERARELVARLASRSFTDREIAQEALTRMGRLALPALLDGLNRHPSPEVRSRCQALVPKASAAEFQARLDTFLADNDGKFEHDLPGWNEFRKAVGGQAAARSVFVELLTDPENRDLLMAMAGPESELGNAVAARKQELYVRRYQRTPNSAPRQPTVSETVALIFAESHADTKLVPRSISVSVLLSPADIRDAILNPNEKGRVYKAVLVHWLNTREDPASIYQGISVASNMNLKEAAGVAAKLTGMKDAPFTYKAQAALTLAKIEARDYLPTLEKMLGDDTPVLAGRVGINGQLQLRDVALAASLMLTGQDPEAFGFTSRYKSSGASMRYSYSNWTIPDDKRKAAFDKWKEWRAKNPEFEKGKR